MQIEHKWISFVLGMGLTIKTDTDKLKIIEYLLSPLLRYWQESLRGRQMSRLASIFQGLKRTRCEVACISVERKGFIFWVAILLLWTGFVSPSAAQTRASLELSWTRESTSTTDELLILDAISDGLQILALATVDTKPAILIGLNEGNPAKRIISIASDGFYRRIATDRHGRIWLGGAGRPALTSGALQSDAYISMFDAEGRLVWEKVIRGNGYQREITSLVADEIGQLFVAGRKGEQSWLAKISMNGDVLWERTFGVAKGVDITILGETLFVAGFDVVHAEPGHYREDVALWSFGVSGEEKVHALLRENINADPYRYAGEVEIVQSDKNIFVLSAWRAIQGSKPMELVEVNMEAQVRRRTEFPRSLAVDLRRGSSTPCRARLASLEHGVVVGCSWGNEINITRIHDGSASSQRLFAPPACQQGIANAIWLFSQGADEVGMLGSRPSGVPYTSNCAWLTRYQSIRLSKS